MDNQEAAIQTAATRLGVTLKIKQVEPIMAFISGSDVFVTLPKGYGKSLIIGLLPWIFDEINNFTNFACF